MSDSLRDLVLAHVPEDGSAIGNGALIARLREIMPSLTDEDYAETKDALVDEGVLGKGKGRGGSVFLVTDDGEDQDDDFELTPTDEPAPKAQRVAAKATPRKAGEPAQVISYRHTDTRVNNPEVGMVHPSNDPDQPKTVWAYDPHLDPALMFDSQRGRIERLIEEAIASNDADTMRDALEELRALQNWGGQGRADLIRDRHGIAACARARGPGDHPGQCAQAVEGRKGGRGLASGRPVRSPLREPALRARRWTSTSTKRAGPTG
jgi:adenine-specific DNA-methyltransferase